MQFLSIVLALALSLNAGVAAPIEERNHAVTNNAGKPVPPIPENLV
jgi:hypothetical protein